MMSDFRGSSKFEAWIFNSFSPNIEALGLYRIFCGLFLLLFLLPDTNLYAFISSLPNSFFAPPPGPMMFFEGFPGYGFLISIHVLLILFLCLMIIGWQTVKTSLISGILILILKGFIYSVGKINHDLLLVVIPILMAFSGWGSAYSLDSYFGTAKKKAAGWPFTLLALIIGFMFFTAGFSKVIGGWLNLDSHAALGHFFKQYFVKGRQDLLADSTLQITNVYIWEIFDYMTVFFEVGFLVAVFYPKVIRIYVSLAVIFHFCTMMVMNISFLPNFVAYAAFLNWDLINDGLKKMMSQFSISSKYYRIILPAFIAAGFFFVYIISSFMDGRVLKSDWGGRGLIIVSGALPVALYYLSMKFFSFFKR